MRLPSCFRWPMFLFITPTLLGADSAGGAVPPVKSETAVIGGGCFWCLEAVYEKVNGVTDVESGYAGGHLAKPDYKSVCRGETGHAEVIKITYDPAKVKYEELLAIFWDIHDPTTLNAQGADKGTQYRSIVLYSGEAQRLAAEKSKAGAQAHFPDKIVTTLEPLKAYWPAEDLHQDYFRKHPDQPYCAYSIPPKLQKLFKKHGDKAVK